VARDLARAVDPLSPKRAAALPFLDQAALHQFALGEDLIRAGNFKDAEPLFRAVAFQYPGFSPAVAGYARCLTKTGNQPAEPVYLWARMAAKAQGYLKAELNMLQFQASHLMAKGERERARALCLEGLQMARAKGLPGHQGVLQNQLGALAQFQNRLGEAEACYQAALGFLKQAGDPEGIARVTNNLAVLEKSQGKLEQAEAHYRSVLDTVVKAGNQWSEAVALNNLGELDLILGRLDQAEDFLNRALALRTRIGDEAGMPYVLVNLAGLAQVRGRLPLALDTEQKALDLTRRLQLRPMEALVLYNLGELNRDAGHYAEAIQAYRASGVLHLALDDKDMQAHALAGEAECLARQTPARLDGARKLLKTSLALSPTANPYLLRTQAWIARGEGRPDEARDLFTRSLALAVHEAPELTRELKESL
jgi:tetratricopeptide (TPR) repeat protein